MSRFSDVLLWLFVVNLGIAFGAGLYESRVVVPEWAGMARETWPNTGLKFWVYVTTVPLTLLTLGSLFAAWQSTGPERAWWLAAAVIILAERIATFAYFIPTMVRLQGGLGVPDAEVKTALTQWLWLNTGRHALTLLGWLSALRALALRGQ